jgi:hypothetical protein
MSHITKFVSVEELIVVIAIFYIEIALKKIK